MCLIIGFFFFVQQMLAEDLEDEPEDKYDEKEMEMVKQMIGLNIGKNTDANDSNEEDRTSNLFSKSNKIYDFNTPSSKVFVNLLFILFKIKSNSLKLLFSRLVQ